MFTTPDTKYKFVLLAIAALLLMLGVAAALHILPARPIPGLTPIQPTPYAPDANRPPPPAVADDFLPQRMTLEGTLECLPHAPGYPPTEECALGLRTDDGTHYVFDTMLMSSIPEEHKVGDRVTGNGVFTPIERLNTDHWRQYTVKGIFSVTDGFRVVR